MTFGPVWREQTGSPVVCMIRLFCVQSIKIRIHLIIPYLAARLWIQFSTTQKAAKHSTRIMDLSVFYLQ